MHQLTHLNARGEANLVDVTEKTGGKCGHWQSPATDSGEVIPW